MTDIKRIGDTGIHTVEGNVSGNRAASLTKKAEIQRQEYELVKEKIKEANSSSIGRISDKFTSGSDAIDQEFRDRTVGLVTANTFRAVRDNLTSIQADELKQKQEHEKAIQEFKEKHRTEKRKKMISKLSFIGDDEENDEESGIVHDNQEEMPQIKKITKNPEVDTSFLPDRERDQRLAEEEERKHREWLEEQERIKKEKLEVVYSYWDGRGHRKSIQITKGTTIGKFLELVKADLLTNKQFNELRSVGSDGLMYVKEDIIIPHHYSFYDLISTKARGKSGPLFHFDVHEDIRMVTDIRIEKDESHPGKVVLRRWYEKNKHIFPASRWEIYDPTVQRTKYTIRGDGK